MPDFGLIDYQLIRSRRKTLSLQIDNNGKLLVRAPMRFSGKKIEAFICEKQRWIVKKQQQIQAQKPLKKQYQTDEEFLFLGKSYPLKLTQSGNPLKFDKRYFYLNTNYNARASFHWFYKKEFIKIALPRLEYYANKHNLPFNQVRFKAQKTRWGSCSIKNNINLNYLLMMAPMPIINNVIAHELAHIAHKNHSKDFYTLLKKIIPKHQHADIWLKQHTQQLHNL